MTNPGVAFEGPLAEYAALRQELESRASRQHQVFTAQLTLCGAIFSFALSDPKRTLLLLIVPVIAYLLTSRHVQQSHQSFLITKYFREELADRVPGGLRWDLWLADQPRPRRPLVSRMPLLLAFPGTALAAIAWTAPEVFSGRPASLPTTGSILIWVVDVVFAISSAVALVNVVKAYGRWWWPNPRTAPPK